MPIRILDNHRGLSLQYRLERVNVGTGPRACPNDRGPVPVRASRVETIKGQSTAPALPTADLYPIPHVRLADFTVLCKSMVMVIGPTPPGTGVMARTLFLMRG